MDDQYCLQPRFTKWIYISMFFLVLVFIGETYYLIAHMKHDDDCARKFHESRVIEQKYIDEHHPDKYINKTE
jgi:hypothetical protein